MVKRAKAPVDAPDELVHLILQLLVPRGVLLGRDGDLDEQDAVSPIGVGVEKLFECDEFVRDPLDVVHPVDTQDNRLSVEAPLQLDHSILELCRVDHGLEGGVIDPSRKSVDRHRGPFGRVEDVV